METAQMRELIEYYREQGAPQDQQMLIALLREAQEACGGALAQDAIEQIAQDCSIRPSMIMALIRRVPGLRSEAARHRLEICGTCRAGAGLRDEIERIYQVKSGASNEAAGFSYHVTPCMKNCKNGPSVKWDGQLFSNMDFEAVRRLIEGAQRG